MTPYLFSPFEASGLLCALDHVLMFDDGNTPIVYSEQELFGKYVRVFDLVCHVPTFSEIFGDGSSRVFRLPDMTKR
ncbi:hypothetical protein Terro_3146 [Terriglobus roseus DSM 18391]|uniref:Uncharacterized protein n=1 Tax=Terriglobus roseus (strain DSM 18391 / NRRL B-41598 / KBS 63) TaxID=926566 RepID=I3ZJF7_TERRK|nr:hypothetical protein Terro_3146 [Terriglobus roseus DSM 18391]